MRKLFQSTNLFLISLVKFSIGIFSQKINPSSHNYKRGVVNASVDLYNQQDTNLFKINIKSLEYDLSKEYSNLGRIFYNNNAKKKKIVQDENYKKSFEKIQVTLNQIKEYKKRD